MYAKIHVTRLAGG